MTYLVTQLKQFPAVTLYTDTGRPCGPVLSFTIAGLQAADIGYILNGSYGIIVRTGLQCAPLIHSVLGTAPQGTVRISISYRTTKKDIDSLTSAVRDLCGT
jgi:selenocysteine lyase/cysteine desulfurase